MTQVTGKSRGEDGSRDSTQTLSYAIGSLFSLQWYSPALNFVAVHSFIISVVFLCGGLPTAHWSNGSDGRNPFTEISG